jgi:mannose-6-phosphate isomerase-like protein (cupin superfamily)
MREPINLSEKLSRFNDRWKPRIVAELNENHVKVVKIQGDFLWHRHEEEDEMFLVLSGTLKIKFRDGEATLAKGEMIVVPKGVEHCPEAAEEAHVLLVEPKTTVNTGELRNDRTAPEQWI